MDTKVNTTQVQEWINKYLPNYPEIKVQQLIKWRDNPNKKYVPVSSTSNQLSANS